MNYFSGTRDQLGATWCRALGRYRHHVFVQHLGWRLPDLGSDSEWDQFDREDTVYVIATNAQSVIVGCARLLPTTRPYLLADAFPQLLGQTQIPASADIWELSRFAAFDPELPLAAGHTLGSPAALDLLRASLRAASRRHARRLVSVSPLSIERILHRADMPFARLAPPQQVDGQTLFACEMPVAPCSSTC